MQRPSSSSVSIFLLAAITVLVLCEAFPVIVSRIIANEDARIEKLDRDVPRAQREVIVNSWGKNF